MCSRWMRLRDRCTTYLTPTTPWNAFSICFTWLCYEGLRTEFLLRKSPPMSSALYTLPSPHQQRNVVLKGLEMYIEIYTADCNVSFSLHGLMWPMEAKPTNDRFNEILLDWGSLQLFMVDCMFLYSFAQQEYIFKLYYRKINVYFFLRNEISIYKYTYMCQFEEP